MPTVLTKCNEVKMYRGMKKEKLSYEKARMLSSLTRAYLSSDKNIDNLIDFNSNSSSVGQVISQRERSFPVDRKLLVKELLSQYDELGVSKQVAKI